MRINTKKVKIEEKNLVFSEMVIFDFYQNYFWINELDFIPSASGDEEQIRFTPF